MDRQSQSSGDFVFCEFSHLSDCVSSRRCPLVSCMLIRQICLTFYVHFPYDLILICVKLFFCFVGQSSANESIQRRLSWLWTLTTNRRQISCIIVSIIVRCIRRRRRRADRGRLLHLTIRTSPTASWATRASNWAARRVRGRWTTWPKWFGHAMAKTVKT